MEITDILLGVLVAVEFYKLTKDWRGWRKPKRFVLWLRQHLTK